MFRIARRLLVAFGLFFAVPVGALAQVPGGAPAQQRPPEEAPKPEPERDPADPMTEARRPYSALFGGATVERERSSGLTFNGFFFEVWDQNLLAEIASPNTSNSLQIGGAYSNLVGDVTYTRSASRVQVAATGGANARYYTTLSKFAASDYHGGIGVSVRPSPLTTIVVNQSLSYAPVNLIGLFAEALPRELGSVQSADSAFAINDDRAVTTDSGANFERRLTPRSLLHANGSYRRSHYLVVTPRGTDFSTVDVGGGLRHRVTENADLRIGYGYRQASFIGAEAFGVGPPEPVEHNVNFGLAFHPSLSAQRRTIVTFEAGSSFVKAPLSTDISQPRRQIRLIGDAAIAHQMGRTWLTVGAFKRGTGFVQGLVAPVFTDSFSVTTTGFFNQRTDLLASVSYSNGEPSLVGSEVTFSTATANARVRVALTGRLAFIAEYVFYQYDFSKVVDLAAGLEPRQKRNTLRAGITFWLPVQR